MADENRPIQFVRDMQTAANLLRTMMRGIIKNGRIYRDIRLRVCDLSNTNLVHVDGKIKPFAKDSASNTEMAFATLVHQLLQGQRLDIMMKMWLDVGRINWKTIRFRPNIEADNAEKNRLIEALKTDTIGLNYEAKMYRFITYQIVMRNVSPHFISYVGFASCGMKNFLQNIPELAEQNLFVRRLIEHGVQVDADLINKLRLNILLTERAGNLKLFAPYNQDGAFSKQAFDRVKPFGKLLTELSPAELTNVWFQIIYSLQALSICHINHFDLHPGNILVVELPKEVKMSYYLGGQYFCITTKYMAYLFDWDFSYGEALGPNDKLLDSEMATFSGPNEFSPYRDLYTLACTTGDGGPLDQYGAARSYKWKEYSDDGWAITADQKAALEAMPPTIQFKRQRIWKLPRAVYDQIFAGKPNLDVNYVYVTLQGQDRVKIAGYACRMMAEDRDFPTAEHVLLGNYFIGLRCNKDTALQVPLHFAISEKWIRDMNTILANRTAVPDVVEVEEGEIVPGRDMVNPAAFR